MPPASLSEKNRSKDLTADFTVDDSDITLLEKVDPSFLENMGREVDSALASLLEVAGRLETPSADVGEVGSQIQRRGEQLRWVFRSMEHLARLSDDQAGRSPETTDAVEVGRDLLDDISPFVRETGLALDLEAPSSSVEMRTHPETLRQALRHILTNAIRCTREGTIVLHVVPEPDMVHFHAEDGGVGMPPEEIPSLFEPFTQRAPEEETVPEGFGLGLSLTRALARHLNGNVEVDSEPGEGRVFTLHASRDVYEEKRFGKEEETEEAMPRLLVVEDNEVTRRLLDRMLQEDYRVDVAAEAETAIESAREKTYDIFVLDVNLKSRRTGVEVLQAIRKMEDYAWVPAVACTAYSLADHREHFLRAGFDDVVAKPVTKREILEVVDHWLNEPASAEPEAPKMSLSGIDLPPVPTTLIKVADLASDPEPPDIDALTEALRKDQVISQWLIHHINSVYYGTRQSIETVERAVRYLGFQPVCNLVLTKVIGESFSGTDEAEGRRVQQYIMNTSTLTAFLAREVAEAVDFDEPEVAYTGGMFAQIGRLAFLEEEGETYVDLWFEDQDRSASFQGPPPQGKEILYFEKDYVQNGLAVGHACSLSDDLGAVLRGHRRPQQMRDQFQPLVPIVALAFEVAHLPGDLGADEPWGDSETLVSTLRDFRVMRLVAEQGPLSHSDLVSAVAEILGEAQEFVEQVSDPS
jgi:HD-like signal output (HDOD) protein/CheY-like chemotaxis protein/anti-sigma regulatory factor (Ser/Thr protein kinase)